MIPCWTSPRDCCYHPLSRCLLCTDENPQGKVFILCSHGGRGAQGCGTPGYPHTVSGILHGAGVPGRGRQPGRSSRGQGRGDAGLAEPGGQGRMLERHCPRAGGALVAGCAGWVEWWWLGETPLLPCAGLVGFPDSRRGGGHVLGGPGSPPWAETVCRAEEHESSSSGGQAAGGTCCSHGSSQHFSQGMKTCLTGRCAVTFGLLGIARRRNFLAPSPLQGRHRCSQHSRRGRNPLVPSCWVPHTGDGLPGAGAFPRPGTANIPAACPQAGSERGIYWNPVARQPRMSRGWKN